MIPTRATNDQLEIYVQNITRVWDAGTTAQVTHGRTWYQAANEKADMMSEGQTRAAAGVIAALSPQTGWDDNLRRAARAFVDGEPTGHMPDALMKAARIMAGEDPVTVLPPDSKTLNFYLCILDPTDPDPVVIDRHAHDIAVGVRYGARERGLSKKRRYATLALAYRIAAQRLGEIPSVIQAVTWVVWREQQQQ